MDIKDIIEFKRGEEKADRLIALLREYEENKNNEDEFIVLFVS